MSCEDEPSHKATAATLGEELQELPFFDRYLKTAQVEDERTAESWKLVASDSLIFSGLFSTVVAAFLAISVRDLQLDPQDKSTFYLGVLLADPNITRAPTFPIQSYYPAFSPPKSAVWVNSLWSLSLVITLSCALLAILVQQWARRYIKVSQRHSASSPLKRARIRAIFHKGVDDSHLQWAVDALPIMLHASLGLFLAGLVIFSFCSNPAVFKVVVSWVGLCTLIYAFFTLRPLFRHESPYHTPLSRPLWLLYSSTLSLPVRTLRWFTAFNCFSEKTWDHFGHLKDDYGRRFSHRIEEAAEESALRSSAQIDSSILLWALQSSDGDHELERFFSSIPDFCGSRVLDDPMAAFKTQNGEKMADALIGLLARTLSSHAVPRSTKQRRIMTCNRAMAKASLPINRRTLGRVLYKDWSGLLNSVEFGLLLRNASYSDEFAKYYSECVVSVIIATVQEHDDRWFELATSQLRMSRTTLENYLAHGDSMLLANCIFISRRTFEAYDKHGWNCDVYSWSKTLESVSRFNVQDTLPELQHEFCDMWNELVRNTGDRRSRNLPIYILKHIRNVYFELHRGTIAFPTAFTDATPNNDSILLFPSSYPSCMIERHHPKSSSIKINDVSETPPKDAPSGLDNATSVAMTSQTQVTPVNGSQRLSPVLPPTRPRGVIEGDTHPNSFSPDFIPPPSNPLRIRGNRTEPMSNTSNSTPVATARAAYTSSNAGHTSTFSAVMQSVDDLPIVSQQSILMAPPSRAVLRQDDRRLNGPLADSTCNTPFSVREDTIPTYSRLTPTSSMSRSDDSPSPSRMGSLETNISTTVLPQQQQSAQFVAATTPDLSPPQRDNRPYPRGKDGPGRSRTTPTRLPTVAS